MKGKYVKRLENACKQTVGGGGVESVFLQHTTQIINLGSVHGYSGRTRGVNSPYMLVGRPTLRCLQECKRHSAVSKTEKNCQIVDI